MVAVRVKVKPLKRDCVETLQYTKMSYQNRDKPKNHCISYDLDRFIIFMSLVSTLIQISRIHLECGHLNIKLPVHNPARHNQDTSGKPHNLRLIPF